MKRKFTTREGVSYNARKREKLEKRRLETKRKKKARRWQEHRELMERKRGARTKTGQTIIKIKRRLDPMWAGTQTIRACNYIRKLVRRGGERIFVDLSNMEEFTLAGAIFLSASIDGVGVENPVSRKGPKSMVSGNMPANNRVASEFWASGFFNDFTDGTAGLPPSDAAWTRARERIVAAKKAEQLVDFAESKIRIKSSAHRRAIWQNLVECMTNTHNHAGSRRVKSKDGDNAATEVHSEWAAGVMCKGEIAYFAFVDLGVGICGSTEAQGLLRKAGITLHRFGPDKMVKKAFEGELGSSTKERGRGLGLPRMRRDAKAGLLEDLQIRTGKVEGKIGEMVFRRVSENMPGTVITWIASSQGR